MARNDPSGSDLDVVRPGSLATLFLRVAATMDHSAKLAEEHAAWLSRQGPDDLAGTELVRAEWARAAARRGRDLAARVQQQPNDHPFAERGKGSSDPAGSDALSCRRRA